MKQSKPPVGSTDALALVGIAGQAGCLTLVVVVVALIAGLWLDRQLGSRPVMTLVMIGASVPVSVILMLRMVLRSMERFHQQRGHVRVEQGNGEPIGGVWREPSAPGRPPAGRDREDED